LKRRSLFLRTAVVLLLVGLAFAEAQRADASSSLTTEVTKEASATFDMQLNGVRTSVDIVAAEYEVTSPEGTQHGLHADIELLQLDSHGGETRLIDVAGSVETQPGGFVLNEDLSTASLHVTIPVCGAKLLNNGRLKQRLFNDCFDVNVDLQWSGSGEITSASGSDEYQAGDCTVQIASAYHRRAASATGTVSGGRTNLTPNASVSAFVATTTHSTAVTCPD
jgi:hypothetical protein